MTLLCIAALIAAAVVYGRSQRNTVQSKPLHPSIVDLLGPWPERLLVIVPLAALALAMALVMLPWCLVGKHARS